MELSFKKNGIFHESIFEKNIICSTDEQNLLASLLNSVQVQL